MPRSAEHPRSQLVPIAARGLDGALEAVEDGDDEGDVGQARAMAGFGGVMHKPRTV